MLCGGEQNQLIIDEDVDVVFGERVGEAQDCSIALDGQLVSSATDWPCQLVFNGPQGNGLEAMRTLMRRIEPRTLGTKRAGLKANTNNP